MVLSSSVVITVYTYMCQLSLFLSLTDSLSLPPSLSLSLFLNKHFMEGFCTWIVPYMYVSSGTQKSCDYYNSVSLSFFPFLSSPSLSVKAGGPISMSSSSSSSISGSLSNTSMKSNTAQQQQPPQPQQQLPNPPLNLPAPPIRPPLPGLPGTCMRGIRRWYFRASSSDKNLGWKRDKWVGLFSMPSFLERIMFRRISLIPPDIFGLWSKTSASTPTGCTPVHIGFYCWFSVFSLPLPLSLCLSLTHSLSVLSGFPPPPIPGFRPPGLPGDPLGGAAALGMLGQHPPIPPPGLPGLPPNLPGLGNPLARPTVVSTV